MIKYIKYLLIISILIVTFPTYKSHVYATEFDYFAQIQIDDVYFFADKGSQPIFEIPKTYYIKLLEDEIDGYYKAQYMGATGYVRANEIQCVEGYPERPYLDYVNFRILAEQSAELRSEPSRVKGINTLIVELPLYETNFIFYGTIEGEEVVPSRGNEWYYTSYRKNGVTEFGYVYSGLTDMFSPFTENALSLYPIPKHNWQIITEDEIVLPNFEPPTTSELAIILAIIIPSLLLLLIMFKTGGKKVKHAKTNNADIIKMPSTNTSTAIPRKKKRGKDYYEIE